MLEKDLERIIVSKQEISDVVTKLGQDISKDYHDKFPIVVGLLKGCIPFMADLLKELDFHLEVGFMDVSSYHGGIESSGDVKISLDLGVTVKGRHVIIAEDIVDTGRTISVVVDLLKYRGAKSVSVVTLLDKKAGRIVDFIPEYVGVSIPKVFVVGYGLDYEEKYRNLPYVGVLKEEIYTSKE